MKKYLSYLTITLLLIVSLSSKSCVDDPDYVAFLIKVDSIQIPIEIKANVPFDIVFYGTIGTNGCYSFREFYEYEANNEIVIEAWGNLQYDAKVCPTVMVYLDGIKKRTTINQTGTYILRIKQPRSADILKQIIVT